MKLRNFALFAIFITLITLPSVLGESFFEAQILDAYWKIGLILIVFGALNSYTTYRAKSMGMKSYWSIFSLFLMFMFIILVIVDTFEIYVSGFISQMMFVTFLLFIIFGIVQYMLVKGMNYAMGHKEVLDYGMYRSHGGSLRDRRIERSLGKAELAEAKDKRREKGARRKLMLYGLTSKHSLDMAGIYGPNRELLLSFNKELGQIMKDQGEIENVAKAELALGLTANVLGHKEQFEAHTLMRRMREKADHMEKKDEAGLKHIINALRKEIDRVEDGLKNVESRKQSKELHKYLVLLHNEVEWLGHYEHDIEKMEGELGRSQLGRLVKHEIKAEQEKGAESEKKAKAESDAQAKKVKKTKVPEITGY